MRFFQDEIMGGGGPGSDVQDETVKASATGAAFAFARHYAVKRGLTVPMRSSVVRGVLELGETAGTAATLAMFVKDEGEALNAEKNAWNSGECR